MGDSLSSLILSYLFQVCLTCTSILSTIFFTTVHRNKESTFGVRNGNLTYRFGFVLVNNNRLLVMDP